MSNGELGVTLSVGEQEPEVYKRWFDAGAHRYLLSVESTNRSLYSKIHPDDTKHDFDRRLDALRTCRISVTRQDRCNDRTSIPDTDDLAGDLLFMKEFDIDMCGMGPYIEHADTPLIRYAESLHSA